MATGRHTIVCMPVSGYVLGVGSKFVRRKARLYDLRRTDATGPAVGLWHPGCSPHPTQRHAYRIVRNRSRPTSIAPRPVSPTSGWPTVVLVE